MSHDHYYQGQPYTIEKEEYKEDKSYTKKPHDAVRKQWDKEVATYLTKTSNLKHQINHYRDTDLKHIKVNLFVNPALAEIVENNLISLEKEIDKIEIEVKRIQHYYENVEDQTTKAGFKSLN